MDSFLFGIYVGMELVSHRVNTYVTSWETSKHLSKVVEPFFILPVMYSVYSYSTLPPLFAFVSLFNVSLSTSEYVMISLSCFNLNFPVELPVGNPSCNFGLLNTLYQKVTYQVIYSFHKSWAIYLFLVICKNCGTL